MTRQTSLSGQKQQAWRLAGVSATDMRSLRATPKLANLSGATLPLTWILRGCGLMANVKSGGPLKTLPQSPTSVKFVKRQTSCDSNGRVPSFSERPAIALNITYKPITPARNESTRPPRHNSRPAHKQLEILMRKLTEHMKVATIHVYSTDISNARC